VRRRIVRLVRRHGIALEGAPEEAEATDRLVLEEPALAAIAGASALGRVATGPRAGHLVLRLGADATAPVVTSAGPRHAHRQGFDLHADVAYRHPLPRGPTRCRASPGPRQPVVADRAEKAVQSSEEVSGLAKLRLVHGVEEECRILCASEPIAKTMEFRSGTVRGASDKRCSVTHSSLSGLSAESSYRPAR